MASLIPSQDEALGWLLMSPQDQQKAVDALGPETPAKEWERMHGLCCHAERGHWYRGPRGHLVAEKWRAAILAKPDTLRHLAENVARDGAHHRDKRFCNCGQALASDCADAGCSSANIEARTLLAKALLRHAARNGGR